MNKKELIIPVFLALSAGLLFGTIGIVSGDLWIFESNNIIPNSSYTDNIKINGTANFTNKLYYGDAEVCTATNGLCGNTGIGTNNTLTWQSECGETTCSTYIETLSSG